MNYTQPDWSKMLNYNMSQILKYIDTNQELKIVEIGSFEGLGTNILYSNLCEKNKKSVIYCIDHWEDKYTNNENFQDLDNYFIGQFERFNQNTENFKDFLILLRGYSDDMIKKLEDNTIDFVLIDGDHSPEQVYKDAVNIFPKMKKNGLILFDDYWWEHKNIKTKNGIDKFLIENHGYLQVLLSNWQLLCKKIRE